LEGCLECCRQLQHSCSCCGGRGPNWPCGLVSSSSSHRRRGSSRRRTRTRSRRSSSAAAAAAAAAVQQFSSRSAAGVAQQVHPTAARPRAAPLIGAYRAGRDSLRALCGPLPGAGCCRAAAGPLSGRVFCQWGQGLARPTQQSRRGHGDRATTARAVTPRRLRASDTHLGRAFSQSYEVLT
jgi:hypothetical protein